MGDRTYAATTIPTIYLPLLLAHKDTKSSWHNFKFPNSLHFCLSDIEIYTDGTTVLSDGEANYGDIGDLAEILQLLRIPNDHQWEAGGDYSAGVRHTRFDEDGHPLVTDYARDLEGMIDISTVLDWIKEGYTLEAVKLELEAVAERYEPYNGQRNLAEIPVREFTEEESMIIMRWKMENKEGV